MPSKRNKPPQAKKQLRALKKLRALGLIKNVDLRKKPSPASKRALAKYADVVSGRAAVVKPKDAKSYRGIFRVVGNKVIIPRRKGERISVDKSGRVVGKRKVGRRIVRSRFRRTKRLEEIERPSSRVQYAIPFNRGGGEIEWKRFPTYDLLKLFMESYDYKDWTDYVVEERIGGEADETLEMKLARKRAKIEQRKQAEWEKELWEKSMLKAKSISDLRKLKNEAVRKKKNR